MSSNRFSSMCCAVFGLFSLSFVLMPAVSAQEEEAETRQLDPIIVTGANQKRIETFVESLAAKNYKFNSLARWKSELCVSLLGPPPEQAQFIIDRIAVRSLEVGLKPGKPGCDTNLLILATDQPDVLLQDMYDRRRSIFAYFPAGATQTLGRGPFWSFMNSDQPVRWWHVSESAPAYGDASASAVGGAFEAPAMNASGTRIKASVRQDLSRVIIVIDTGKTAGRPLSALADYVALASLAQLDPDVDTQGFDSILNLFNGDTGAPAGMTQWDLAFLDGLYRSRPNTVRVSEQYRDIARRMTTREEESSGAPMRGR